MEHLIPLGKGVAVTTATDATLVGRQQTRPIANMWIMTNGTGISCSTNPDVTMDRIETGQCLFMTIEAKICIILPYMTRHAVFLRKGAMLNSTQQRPIGTPMRIVAGKTIDCFQFSPQVRLLQPSGRLVTTKTE